MDEIDRVLVRATQAGLPLTPRPYHDIADLLGLTAQETMARLTRLSEAGAIRRIGAVPNHYALGYRHNGMTVWDVADADIAEAGRMVAELPFVSHCYQRPRFPPDWPYNLFAMVHARDRAGADAHVAEIAAVLGPMVRHHQVLYSTRILKKTGLRLSE